MENKNRLFESEPLKTTPKFSTCWMNYQFDQLLSKNPTLDVVGEREKGTSEVSQQAELANRLNGVAHLILKPMLTTLDVSHDVAPSEGQKQNVRRSKAVQNKRRWCVLNKKIVLGILLTIIASVSITYAVMTAVYDFGGTGTIAGEEVKMKYECEVITDFHIHFPSFGVSVVYLTTDGTGKEVPGDFVETIAFGTVYQEPSYSDYLMICGDCNQVSELVSLTDDLDPAIGTCTWEIQYLADIGTCPDQDPWNWETCPWVWTQYDPENTPDQKGGSTRPLKTGYIGLFDHPPDKSYAYWHLRLKFVANPDAPKGDFSFTITVTGTEC
jgi:hypothetical protein